MNENYLDEKVNELKAKFSVYFQQRKKISALDNFSGTGKFRHQKFLGLVKICMHDGFLCLEEEQFLEFMLDKYHIFYLDWAHRNAWVKTQLAKKKAKKPAAIQTVFNFEKQEEAVSVPVAVPTHLIAIPKLNLGLRL